MKFGIKRYLHKLKKQSSQKPYNNIDYWKEEGTQYFDNYYKLDNDVLTRYNTQADLIIKFLSELNFNSICEVGCGFGRITHKILDAFDIQKQNYFAFDVSSHQIQKCKQTDGDRAEFFVSTINDFEPSRQFDLVFASEVLMHIPHNEISQAISKIVELSSKYIVNIDWNETDGRKSSYCNFAHDYSQLYKVHGLETKVIQLDELAKDLPIKINQNLNFVDVRSK